jgi:hypothetical protein
MLFCDTQLAMLPYVELPWLGRWHAVIVQVSGAKLKFLSLSRTIIVPWLSAGGHLVPLHWLGACHCAAI